MTNYPVSDVFIKVANSENQALASRTFRAVNTYTFSVDMDAVTAPDNGDLFSSLSNFANGDNTITITVQLGNGERITVFQGAFTK